MATKANQHTPYYFGWTLCDPSKASPSTCTPVLSPLTTLEPQFHHFSPLFSVPMTLPSSLSVSHFKESSLPACKHADISHTPKNKSKPSLDSTSPASFCPNSLLPFARNLPKVPSLLSVSCSFPPAFSESHSSQAFASIPMTKPLMPKSPLHPKLLNSMSSFQPFSDP